jgi:hypothetical protein
MVFLQTARIFNYQMIPNAGDNIIVRAPSMGPINGVVVMCVFAR